MKRERLWYRDDITGPQRLSLRLLADTVSGSAYAGNLRGIRLQTLGSLLRYGLITAESDPLVAGTVVKITSSGREAIADGN